MTYLVDANALGEPTRLNPNARVVEWLRRTERDLVVDPIILGEIRFGIHVLADGRRRRRLERWFEDGVQRIHCLSWDLTTGLRGARLLADLRAAGQAMPIKDSLIAATGSREGGSFSSVKTRPWAGKPPTIRGGIPPFQQLAEVRTPSTATHLR